MVLPGSAAAATTFTVTTTVDTAGGSCVSGSCSLRQAVGAASNGDTIDLPAGTYTLTNGQLHVATGVTITGVGQAATTIQGASAGQRVMVIFGNSASVTLAHLTVTGGPGGVRRRRDRRRGSRTPRP